MPPGLQAACYNSTPYIEKKPQTKTLTVFTGLNVENVAADSISGLSVGQNLDTVVGELLQTTQFHLLARGGDILHLAPFCRVDGEF